MRYFDFERIKRLTGFLFHSNKTRCDSFTLAGIQTKWREDGFLMNQAIFLLRLRLLSLKCTFEEFRARRNKVNCLTYCFTHTHFDFCSAVAIVSRTTERKFERTHVNIGNNTMQKTTLSKKKRVTAAQKKQDVIENGRLFRVRSCTLQEHKNST